MIARHVLVLLLLGATIVVGRAHTYHEPFETDITGAAVIGRELLQGRRLYSEIWDHKPPALHLTHAAAVAVAGTGPAAIFVLNLGAALTSLAGVYVAAARFSPAAALWAAAFWAAVSGDLWMQANQPNTEAFINACVIWALALLLHAHSNSRVWRFAAVGALFALASLYKQVVIAPVVFLVAAHVVAPPEGRSRRQAVVDVLLVAGVGVAAWTAVLGYFALEGRLAHFWSAVFDYNRHYIGRFPSSMRIAAFGTPQLAGLWLSGSFPLFVVAVAGLVAGAFKTRGRPWCLLVALGLATPIAVALPGQLSAHYYQLWLPVLVLGAAFTVSLVSNLRFRAVSAAPVLGAALVVLVLAGELPYYGISAEDWSVAKYGEIFVEERRLGREIDQLLLPNEAFYEWGSEVGLYYWSRRRVFSGAFSAWPAVVGPEASRLQAQVFADLRREPPELYVRALWTDEYIRTPTPATDWLAANYRPLPVSHPSEFFALYVRRGGALERRLTHAAR